MGDLGANGRPVATRAGRLSKEQQMEVTLEGAWLPPSCAPGPCSVLPISLYLGTGRWGRHGKHTAADDGPWERGAAADPLAKILPVHAF